MLKQKLNFDIDVTIDLDSLESEWQTHAQIRYDYATEVAYLDKVVKQQNKLIEVKKTKLTVEISKLILQIKTGNPKATVQMVDAETIDHKDLISFRKDLLDSQDKLIIIEYDLNMAKNALKAFDDRKTALENEVILWTRNYFATPREKEERMVDGGKGIVNSIKDEKAQKHREGINQTHKRTRRV